MTRTDNATSPVSLRYVVLHHTGHGESHFDLMLEPDGEGTLLTFRVARWPVTNCSPLTPLPDHRRAYLTYEGPVSGDRGQVRRVEAGTHWTIHQPDAPHMPTMIHLTADEREHRPVRWQEIMLGITRSADGTLFIEPAR